MNTFFDFTDRVCAFYFKFYNQIIDINFLLIVTLFIEQISRVLLGFYFIEIYRNIGVRLN